GGHVAEVAQLGARVAGGGQLVEHAVPRHLVAEALYRAPGAGGVRHADRGPCRHPVLRSAAVPTSLTATRLPSSRLSCAASARRRDSTASRTPGDGSSPRSTARTKASSSRRYASLNRTRKWPWKSACMPLASERHTFVARSSSATSRPRLPCTSTRRSWP